MTQNAKYQANYYQRHKVEYRRKILELGKCKCAICGYTDQRALEVDHMRGEGSKHRKRVGGIGYYKQMYVMFRDQKARILCRNCNWIEYSKRTNRYNMV